MAASAADLERKVALTNEKVIGNGSFGVVFQATLVETGETVAVKKVLQDKRFKVRRTDSDLMIEPLRLYQLGATAARPLCRAPCQALPSP